MPVRKIGFLSLMFAAGALSQTLTTLYSFTGGADGLHPLGPLVRNAEGQLFGTTYAGGSKNLGTVFVLTPPSAGGTLWKQTVILNFDGPNGSLPYGAPIQGGSGALYGTTYYGGSYGYGIVYMLTPPLNAGKNWTFTSLYNFSGPDGEHPASGLTEDASGNLYGTSVAGGTLGGGTAFELSPPG